MNDIRYKDLGLPSGTLWADETVSHEGDVFFDHRTALELFGGSLPCIEDFKELYDACKWEWDDVYKCYFVTGRGERSLMLPAAGLVVPSRHTQAGAKGCFWSAEKGDTDDYGRCLSFSPVSVCPSDVLPGNFRLPVRLVKRSDAARTWAAPSSYTGALYGYKALSGREIFELKEFYDSVIGYFFEEDEKEDFESLVSRVGPHDRDDVIRGFAYVLRDGAEIIGGMIAEWYPQVRVLEITYIAVREKYQGVPRTRYADVLLANGLRQIRRVIGEDVFEYVVFEFKDPYYVDGDGLHVNDEEEGLYRRLNFFRRNGARRIPIRYVRPPLSEKQDFARDMSLFCLPRFSPGMTVHGGLPSGVLHDFLDVFYGYLLESTGCQPVAAAFEAELTAMGSQIDAITSKYGNVLLADIF